MRLLGSWSASKKPSSDAYYYSIGQVGRPNGFVVRDCSLGCVNGVTRRGYVKTWTTHNTCPVSYIGGKYAKSSIGSAVKRTATTASGPPSSGLTAFSAREYLYARGRSTSQDSYAPVPGVRYHDGKRELGYTDSRLGPQVFAKVGAPSTADCSLATVKTRNHTFSRGQAVVASARTQRLKYDAQYMRKHTKCKFVKEPCCVR